MQEDASVFCPMHHRWWFFNKRFWMMEAFWGHSVSLCAIRHHEPCQQNIWKTCQKKAFVPFNHKCVNKWCLEFTKRYRNFDWNWVWLVKTNIEHFGHKHSRWVWHKKHGGCKENSPILTVKHTGGTFDAVCPANVLETWHVLVLHEILGDFKWKSGVCCQEATLCCGWIF